MLVFLYVITRPTTNTTSQAKNLVTHEDVEAMWYFRGSAEGSFNVEQLSSGNMKRTFTDYGNARDWLDNTAGEGEVGRSVGRYIHAYVHVYAASSSLAVRPCGRARSITDSS